jgi:HK97 family phage major capsid protein
MADENKDQQVSMDDLKGIIAEAVKGSTAEQIAALKAEMEKVNRKQMFPSGEGDIYQSGKSIVDTSFFTKDYSQHRRLGVQDANQLGFALRGAGGPFLSLSPVMEKFAQICKFGADHHKCLAAGISIADYNVEAKESNAKILGEKAMTSADAGVIIPVEYMATVIEFAVAQSQILPKLWRISMGTSSLKIPKLVQAAGSYFGGITLYHPGEGGQKTPTKPTFDSMTFNAKKLIGLIAMTDELIADSSINIVNYITGLFVRAFQWQTEHEVVQGTGLNNQMSGIITDPAINLVPRTTAGTVKYDDLINLDSAMDENFSSLTYLTRRATLNTFRKQKDSNSNPIFHEGYSTFLGGPVMPPTLMGEPVIKTRNVPELGIQGDIVLGDLGFYIWALRQDMTIDTSRDFRFDYDETTLRFVVRQDGACAVPLAFAILEGGLS